MAKSRKKKHQPRQDQSTRRAFGDNAASSQRGIAAISEITSLLKKGLELHNAGEYETAKKYCQKAVELQPKSGEAWYLLGAVSTALGNYQQAVQDLNRAIQLIPNEAECYFHLGNAWYGLGEFELAIAAFRDALRLKPNHIDAKFNLGNMFLYLRQFSSALSTYQEVLDLNPNHFHAVNNLGHALFELERYDEAIAAFERTIELDPNYLDAYMHIGNVFQVQDRYEEAMDLYEQILKKQPQKAGVYNNIANILKKQAKYQESLATYEKCVLLNPQDPEIHLNIALVLLLLGDFKRGWQEHELRLNTSRVIPKDLKTPIWQGNSIQNEELLLWSEQGFGDSIQFIRYAILLQQQGFDVTVATRLPLLKLFKHCLEPSIKVIDQDNTSLSHYQNHNSLMGLPYLFQTNLETIPQDMPYLFPAKDISTELQLPETTSLKIGLVWAAGTVNKELYKSKSIELDNFLQVQQEILKTQKVSFWSLQIGEDAQQIQSWLEYENIHDLSHNLKDFLDTANIINQLDLIITVDTAVAHLAGAMGKPVWVMLPFVPDWRWLLDRADSPWYPTMTLFRQSTIGDWQSVFQDIKTRLQQLIKQDKSSTLRTLVSMQEISKKSTIAPILATSFHDAVSHYCLGEQLQAEGEFLEAIAEYQKSIELRADQVEVYNAIGNAFNNIGDFHQAEKAFDQATNIEPTNPILYYNLGNMLLLQNKNEEAIIAYDQSLQLNPQNRDALNNRGHALSALGKYDEARQSFEEILTFLPNDADSYNHIGSTFHQQERYEEAIHYFQQAYELNPENITIEYNLANGLRDIGDYSGAIQHYRNVLEREPEDKKTHYNLGWVLLLTGNYKEGWQEHEWRFNRHDASDRLLPTPIWDGTIKPNQHLLLWSEQGFGDCIQFIRYLPLCLELKQEVTISTRSPLVRLFRECLGVKVTVVNQDQIENIESYNAHAPLMSLANIFESTEEKIPKTIPYIFAPKVIPSHLKLPSTRAKKIGIVWGSNTANSAMYQAKSIDLDAFLDMQKDLIESEQISFFGLQVGEDAEKIKHWVDNQAIYDVSPLLNDFYDTASIIEQLDLVITIDTAVAHLAGAMGKSVWVLLPYTPDWRWLVEREDTPWYPTMQLFRQNNKGDWESIYEAVHTQLTAELLLESFALSAQELVPVDVDNKVENISFYRNIADGLLEQGRFDEAIASYQKIQKENPDDPQIHKGLGKAYLSQNQFAIADQHFQQAIKLMPDSAELYFECGNAYFTQGKYDEAVSFYQQAIQLDSSFLNAYDKLVSALLELQKKSEAIDVLETFVSIASDKASIYNQIGCLHYDQSNYQQAIDAFGKGLEVLPNNTALLYNQGNALQAIDETDAAIICYQKVLAQNPQDVNVIFNYGCVLQKQEKFEDAAIKFQEVLKIQPDHQGAQCNLGFSLQADKKIEEAIQAHAQVTIIDPDNADSHCNLAIALLLTKHFEQGWQEYEWRLKMFPPRNEFEIWQGQQLNSKDTLLLWSEQGFGDSLQFVRYAALLQAQGHNITIATSKPLMRLFKKCLQLPVNIINIDQDDLSIYKNHIPLASLPKLFLTTDVTIPAIVPYIHPPTKISPHLKLPALGIKKIGIVWASRSGHTTYRARTLNVQLFFAAFNDLFGSAQISFWSLQVGEDAEQIQPWLHHANVTDLSPLLKDFHDTASVIQQLDLVITVDTAVAHLAGAMGKPVWILLPFIPDWRWQLDRTDSPWYPTARLFRQPKRGDWMGALQQVRDVLSREFNIEFPPENWLNNLKNNELIKKSAIQNNSFYTALGQSLAEQGKIDEAIAAYEQALKLEPNSIDLLNRLAIIFFNRNDYDTAAQYYQQAIAIQSNNSDLYYNLATIYLIQEKHNEAIIAYQEVIRLSPHHSGAYNNLSIALTHQKRYAEAIEVLKNFLPSADNQASIYNQIGSILYGQKQYQEAIVYFQQAIQKEPNIPDFLYNLGNAYQHLERYSEAVKYYSQVLELEPTHKAAQFNIGNALQDLAQFEKAIAAYRRTIAIDPDNAGAHLNLSLLLLLTANFEQGWEEYEWRFDPSQPKSKFILTPMWEGQPIEDELLLWSEQGMGDSIQFVRYVSILKAQGIKVTLATMPSLVRLFKDCLETSVMVFNQESKDFDINQYKYHASLMSLPRILQTREKNIPAKTAYISTPSIRKASLKIPSVLNKKIGVVWASGIANTSIYGHKSLDIQLLFQYLSNLINTQQISIWSLQVGRDADQIQPWVDNSNVFDLSPLITDFHDTANLIAQLDLIITVDTAVAHLAGAMGKPVWVMLPSPPDWRWQLERQDSPWYPTARLFRQSERGNWMSVLQQVRDALSREFNIEFPPENWPSNLKNNESIKKSETQNSAFYTALGQSLVEQGKIDEAIITYEEALKLEPNNIDLLNRLAVIFFNRNDYDMAAYYFQQGIAIQSNNADLHYNLGTIYLMQEKHNEAIISYQEVIRLNPHHSGAYHNLSIALTHQKRYEEALKILNNALYFSENKTGIYNQIGNIYYQQNAHQKAHIYYNKIIELDPSNVQANYNLGLVFYSIMELNQAISACEKALKSDPHNSMIHNNLAIMLLLKGDLRRGWIEHEWRFETLPDLRSVLDLEKQLIKNNEILIWGEHGFGDWIQFCRYTKLLNEMGAQVTIAVKVQLVRLFRECLDVSVKVINSNETTLDNYPLKIELLSLPQIFDTTEETIPSTNPYIIFSQKVPSYLKIPRNNAKQIGIVWSCGTVTSTYQIRSIDAKLFFNAFSDLLGSTQVSFWSLQVGEDAAQIQPWLHHANVTDLSPLLKDFHDTASVIQQLDLVITVDTAVAHLAGAMGKSVWILLPYLPCWRWQLDRNDSPWYPTVRLFRQSERGNWMSVLQQVRDALSREFNIEFPPENWPSNLENNESIEKSETQNSAFYTALGQSLVEQGKIDEAIITYEEALKLEPNNIDLLNRLAVIFFNRNDYDMAAYYFQQGIAIQSNNADLHYNLGTIYLMQEKHNEAIISYQEVIRLNPHHSGAYHNLSIALTHQKRYEEALEVLENFLPSADDQGSIYSQIGLIFYEMQRLDQAISACEQALKINPHDSIIHSNLGMMLLLKGDLRRGWVEYEWSFGKPPDSISVMDLERQLIEKNEILIWGEEQGFGDWIQFCRYTKLLNEMGAQVTIAVKVQLVRLFRKCLDVNVNVINSNETALDNYPLKIDLLSLPKIFDTTEETIPSTNPYIIFSQKVPSHLKIPRNNAKQIGIVWASGAGHITYNTRASNARFFFNAFSDLLGSTQASFWSLQVGEDAEQIQPWLHHANVTDLSPLLKDFYDTASVIQQLDLVITVDTAVAHLAGAMGKPVWVVLPNTPDWRWQLNRQDSPWYPTMRLFRQPKQGDWESVLEQVYRELFHIILCEPCQQDKTIDHSTDDQYNSKGLINTEKIMKMPEGLKLNLGCGHKKKEGYINVDKFGDPDIRFDLETFPWPWEDNSVEEIIMSHVLEHLGQSTDVYMKIIQELYRICRHDAVIDIHVPHYRHDNFIIDPTHVRIITPEGLSLFSQKENLRNKEAGIAITPLGLYYNVDFEVRDVVCIPSGEWAEKWISQDITQEELAQASRRYNNVYQEIHIKLIAVKNAASN